MSAFTQLNAQQMRALKSQITELIHRKGIHNSRSVLVYRHYPAEDYYYEWYRRQFNKKAPLGRR